MLRLTLVVAATMQNGIGRGGTLPWHIPKDLSYFARVTMSAQASQTNAVIMGRKTWESIPLKFRPLKKRINVVLSRNSDYELFPGEREPAAAADSTYLFSDLETAVETFGSRKTIHRLFVIGGSSLYKDALGHQQLRVDNILMTRIHNPDFDCDVFFPNVLGGSEWRRASHEEHSAWVGFDIPAGIQTENGIDFEYQMWIRSSENFGRNGEDS